jgi:hypothetical protein
MYASFLGFGPSWFGRWDGWKEFSLYIPNRIDPNPLQWDGGTAEYYLNPFTGITDYKVMSPQIEAMNWIFMYEEALKLNPNFWFEFMPWDGATKGQPGWSKSMRDYWPTVGQTWTPQRWAGMNQFGLWLLRPRVIREYRFHTDKRSDYESYFTPLIAAVDRVHTNPVLTEFWRTGTLVPNRAHKHPYQSQIPTEYANKDRWFLLDANVNAPFPWTLSTEVKVFSMALSLGSAGSRRWLVYAHSPVADRSNVQLTIPEYGAITVNVSIGGSFYLVNEATRTVTPVN